MSGGSLEYLCYKISNAMDYLYELEISEDEKIDTHGAPDIQTAYITTVYHPFRQKHYQRLFKHLRKVEKVLHDIEWAIDGDIGMDDADKTVKRFLNSIQRAKKDGGQRKKNK